MEITIKTINVELFERYNNGEITLHQAAEEFCKAGWDNFVDEEKTRKRMELMRTATD